MIQGFLNGPIRKIDSFTHETVEIGKKELPIGKFYLNSFLKLQK